MKITSEGKMTACRIALIAALFFSVSCQERSMSPSQPSPAFPGYDEMVQDVLANWSPHIGVHATGEAFEAYQDVLPRLAQAGTLRGVRVELDPDLHLNNHVIKMIDGLSGIEMLMLVGNGYLFDADIERRMDEIFAAYPNTRYFQIGNEITTILPKSGPTMTIEEYMAVLKRIYNHAQTRHPGRAVLLTQSTLGAGSYGSEELEKMVKLGLTEMSPDRLIIAVNCYSPAAASQYAGVLSGPLRRYRVWVTETGDTNPDLHPAYVRTAYRELRHSLRAERIYWYALWTGDAWMGANSGDEGFGLLRQPGNFPEYWKSPLLKILLGETIRR